MMQNKGNISISFCVKVLVGVLPSLNSLTPACCCNFLSLHVCRDQSWAMVSGVWPHTTADKWKGSFPANLT